MLKSIRRVWTIVMELRAIARECHNEYIERGVKMYFLGVLSYQCYRVKVIECHLGVGLL